MKIESVDPDVMVERVEFALPPTPKDIAHEYTPLEWALWRKYYIVFLVSTFTLMAQMGSALINPSFVTIASELHVTVEEASYSITIYMLFAGVFPVFIAPFANIYGRRPLYLIFTVLSVVGFIVSAASPSWGGLIAGRVLSAIGCSIPLGIGAATICDLFPQGQRGLPMGIFAWATTNGPHIAPLAGGYISQNYGWRWCNWISAIIEGGLLLLAVFTLPETLVPTHAENKINRSTMHRMLVFGKIVDRPIQLQDFFLPLRLIQYAAVTLPCIMYMVNLSYGSPLFAVTGSFISAKVYHFDLGQTGLFLGLPLTVGCVLGELSAGWVSDLIINTYAKYHAGYRKAEARLYLLPLVLLTAIGTATFGYCIEERKPWIQSSICMAVSGFGTQIATTVTYTYCCDSYPSQSSDVSIVINLYKSLFAFNVGFYALPTAEQLGFTAGFSIFAAISAVVTIPVFVLIFCGEKIRRKQGVPITGIE
ncbi:major facilitator superfamily domain-containing protein [Penicillium hetheringtonii]|uniref:Major facilitator superfamily domain-containing protein n=1 Tax=Penicillium hetheringtonii TaxID=911720 RepID=A0AAD6DIQ2_9EURO|nr:major facilitator superfamily domain-containing protein [Penicillium hetheringtonii]